MYILSPLRLLYLTRPLGHLYPENFIGVILGSKKYQKWVISKNIKRGELAISEGFKPSAHNEFLEFA